MEATLLAEGCDFSKLMELVLKNSGSFDEVAIRTAYVEDSPYKESHDIILRYPEIDPHMDDELGCINYPPMIDFSKELYPHLSALMTQVGGISTGRIVISVLEAGKKIAPHVEEGEAADFFHRFHLVVYSDGGFMTLDGREFEQKTGEVWWVNTKKVFSAENKGEVPMVVILIDLELMPLTKTEGGEESE